MSERPELSKSSRYWMEKHRYYELKHFCLQYPGWKKEYTALLRIPSSLQAPANSNDISDPTQVMAEKRLHYREKIELVEHTALEADSILARYLLCGVTDGMPYDILKLKLEIPCSRDSYYDLYRRFFWLLDKYRE